MEKMTWEVITPEKAEKYLAHNIDNNRILRKTVVEKYARDMANGNWDIDSTDNKITFNADGYLVDGQHRLNAVIKADVPIKMRVFTGVNNNASVFDRGLSRSVYDLLSMSGKYRYLNNEICSTARLMFQLLFGKNNATDSEIDQLLELNYELYYSANMMTRKGSTKPVAKRSACMVGAFLAMKSGVSENELYPFFEIVNTGLPNDECKNFTPALVLRNQLIDIRENGLAHTGGNAISSALVNITTQAIYDCVNGKGRRIKYDVTKQKYANAGIEVINEFLAGGKE